MGQIKTTISLIMIALFSVAIVGFAVNVASDNDAPVNLANDDGVMSFYSNQKGNLTSLKQDTEDTRQSIIETSVSPESGSAQSIAPFTITNKNALSLAKNVVKIGYSKIFGNNEGFKYFVNTLIAILVFMMGLYAYKTLRGMPD